MKNTMKNTIMAAYYVADRHRDQHRKECAYINNPFARAYVLTNEVHSVPDEDVICAAILYDPFEDAETIPPLLFIECFGFGDEVEQIVLEVTDYKTLPKDTRKQLQIDHAPHLSKGAKLVMLADKICNLRDMANSPPADWTPERVEEYFEWAKAVVDAGLRGVHDELEELFDEAYSYKPKDTYSYIPKA